MNTPDTPIPHPSSLSDNPAPAAESQEMEIDLLAFFYRLLEKFWLLAVAALLSALVAAIVCHFLVTPMYQATSQLYVVNSRDSAVDLSDLQFGSYLAKDYERVFTAWEVHEMVLTKLNLDYTYEEITSQLQVNNPDNTRILTITFTSSDPQEARDVANAYAEVSMQYISDVMLTDRPTLLSSALLPVESISISPLEAAAIGFLLGGFITTVSLFICFLVDDKIKSGEMIQQKLRLPVLAVVPKHSSKHLH